MNHFLPPLAPKFRVNRSQSPHELGDLGGLPSIRAGGLLNELSLNHPSQKTEQPALRLLCKTLLK
jgi:hypothetical protein